LLKLKASLASAEVSAGAVAKADQYKIAMKPNKGKFTITVISLRLDLRAKSHA
jgi:hypothetical protein